MTLTRRLVNSHSLHSQDSCQSSTCLPRQRNQNAFQCSKNQRSSVSKKTILRISFSFPNSDLILMNTTTWMWECFWHFPLEYVQALFIVFNCYWSFQNTFSNLLPWASINRSMLCSNLVVFVLLICYLVVKQNIYTETALKIKVNREWT